MIGTYQMIAGGFAGRIRAVWLVAVCLAERGLALGKRTSLLCGQPFQRLDFWAWLLLGLPQVPLRLHPQPNIGGSAQPYRKAQGHLRRYTAVAVQHLG